jgi:hypothetical protein
MSAHLGLAPYVKVYLLENGACIAKKKTRIARKTLDPLYQQSLVFDESPQGKVLQVSKLCLVNYTVISISSLKTWTAFRKICSVKPSLLMSMSRKIETGQFIVQYVWR